MKVAYRLSPSLAPAAIGALAIAVTTYGFAHRGASRDGALVAAATVAAISLAVAWWSAHLVSQRGRTHPVQGGTTHSDGIESLAEQLALPRTETATARVDALRPTGAAQRRMAEYAALIAEVASAARRRVDDARMPVHILLTAQFGLLNENQEEMLGTADAALTSLEEELAKLAMIADIDRGALSLQRSRVDAGEILRTLSPMLQALASKEGVRLTVDVEPAMPRVLGDVPRLRDALRLALTDDIRYAVPGSTVTVQAHSVLGTVSVVVHHGSRHSHAGNILLAARLLDMQGGSLEHVDGTTVITMPREGIEPMRPRVSQPAGAMP